jgi:hypothetical protein
VTAAFKMQSDDNDNKNYDDDYVIDSCTSGSNILSSSTSVSGDDECEKRCSENKDEIDESSPIYVPDNPTSWTEKHIETWIKWATKQFDIEPQPDPKRFPTTGDELVKFTKADFYMTCGSIEGGKSLVQHFKYLMERIKYDFDESLNSEEDPSKKFIIF